METSLFNAIRSDLSVFAEYLFDGVGYQPGRANLAMCLEARLVETRRKTHQPAGAALAGDAAEADAFRQRMNRATLADWSDSEVRSRLFETALGAISEPQAWIVDDTGFEKKGNKSPGVQRQYCGTAGKVTNCQLVVSTHLASFNSSLPVEMSVYLPQSWCDSPPRRLEAQIPDEIEFCTKPELALRQLQHLRDQSGLSLPVLADAGYGNGSAFRAALRDKGMTYVVAVNNDTMVWRPGEGPDAAQDAGESRGLGRPRTRALPGTYTPVSVAERAREIARQRYRRIRLQRGRKNITYSRFAFERIRIARNAERGAAPGAEEWLIIEWPDGSSEPTHYFLANLPRSTRPAKLAELAKLRWRIERDYQDMKQEIGLAHYEGRRWRGLQHHLTISMAAFCFLAIQRELFPPEDIAITGAYPPRTTG